MPCTLCVSLLALLLCAPFACAWGEAPAPGEVALRGHVVSVDPATSVVTINVSQLHTPDGETCLNPPQPRQVDLRSRPVLYFLNQYPPHRPPGLGDFQPGRRVFAVGPDPGPDAPMLARWVGIEASAAPPPGPSGSPPPSPLAPWRLDLRSPLFLAGTALLLVACLSLVLLVRRLLRP